MSNQIYRQAEQYRHRAQEVRTTAHNTRDLNSQEALRRLANGYDRLADNLERVASRADQAAAPKNATGS